VPVSACQNETMIPSPDPRVRPVPVDIIRTRRLGKVSAREVRAIVRPLADHEPLSRNWQALALLLIIRDKLQCGCSLADIGSVFKLNKGSLHRVRSQGMGDIKHDTGIPPLLSVEEEASMITHITDRYQRSCPVCPRHARPDILQTMQKRVSSSWTWRLIRRHQEVLQCTPPYP
jgi:hypothetical protein